MDLNAFCALFLVCLTAVRCAPTGPGAPDACADVRNSSAEFNQIARMAVLEARRVSRDVGEGKPSLVWMEAGDKCDPASLRHNSKPCVGKMLRVLADYGSAVETVAAFRSCAALARTVTPALRRLQQDVSRCTGWTRDPRSNAEQPEPEPEEEEEEAAPVWQEPALCRYVTERLFSFSILTARVFAVGDPALHDASAHRCL